MPNYEQIRDELLHYEKYLTEIIEKLNQNKEEYILGYLHVTHAGTKPQFARRIRDEKSKSRDKRSEKHLSTEKDFSLISRLAQQDYERTAFKEAEKQLQKIQSAIKILPEHDLSQIFTNLPEARKPYVKPLVPDRDQFIRDWCAEEYLPQPFSIGAPEYLSEKGEKVRSKSEKIIADRYSSRSVNYRYECPLDLEYQGRILTLHPDFTVLNSRTLDQFYHEHLGMMDDIEYVQGFLRRLDIYRANDIILGENLLITYETRAKPLRLEQVDQLIDHYYI